MELINYIVPFVINYIVPFVILLTIVVFIHEYGHYYFAKKYGVGITDFSIGLVEKFLDGTINPELDGKYVGFLWVDMLNFLAIAMYLANPNNKKL